MSTIVGVVGMCGAGKSEATKRFIDKGFKRIYFGDVTFDEMKRRGLELNHTNERLVRESLRAGGDLAIYAKMIEPKIRALVDAGENIVLESLYGWSEYKYLEEIYGNQIKLLAIVTDKDVRVSRLKNRDFRPMTEEEVKTRDYAQIEKLEQGGPIAKADHYILNNGDYETFEKQLDQYIDSLLQK